MLEVRDLYKAFGKVRAVDGASFIARDGQITGLLGPNGAGKTTTLRMLYTLMRPDRGQVLVDGADVAADPLAARRRLGVLPDARGLYKRLSCRESIEYFGALHGLDRATARKRCDELIALLDLKDIAERRTEGFSQGERVKTAIGCALVHDPRNLILDEPTNGLDPRAQRDVQDRLRAASAAGKTVFLSTHLLDMAEKLCTRVAIVHQGALVSVGPVGELRQTLASGASLEEVFLKVTQGDDGAGPA
jgi:sodium transport system ATP-binding protein